MSEFYQIPFTMTEEITNLVLEIGDKYICGICGYVYDPAKNDGVAFEDLPEDWKYPRCKQPKDKFNKA